MIARKLKWVVESFLIEKYEKQTAESYIYAINAFQKRYPNAKRRKLEHVETYLMELKKKGCSRNYRAVQLAAIKAYYQCLVEVGEISEHPCRSFKISERKPSGKNFEKLLTVQERESLLSIREERYRNLENRNKAITSLLIYQGITSKELVSLRLKDVDFDDQSIYIKPNNTNRSRRFQLRENQLEYLRNYMDEERPNLIESQKDVLFVNIRGNRITADSLHAFISRMKYGLNKPLSPKSIRDSVINYWLNVKGIPLEDVQLMAGHRYPSSTEKHLRNRD